MWGRKQTGATLAKGSAGTINFLKLGRGNTDPRPGKGGEEGTLYKRGFAFPLGVGVFALGGYGKGWGVKKGG